MPFVFRHCGCARGVRFQSAGAAFASETCIAPSRTASGSPREFQWKLITCRAAFDGWSFGSEPFIRKTVVCSPSFHEPTFNHAIG